MLQALWSLSQPLDSAATVQTTDMSLNKCEGLCFYQILFTKASGLWATVCHPYSKLLKLLFKRGNHVIKWLG